MRKQPKTILGMNLVKKIFFNSNLKFSSYGIELRACWDVVPNYTWPSGRPGTARHVGLPGRAQPGVVPDQGPRHGLLGRFSGQAGTRRHGLPSVPGWPEAHREGKGRAGLQEAGRRGRPPPPPARSPWRWGRRAREEDGYACLK